MSETNEQKKIHLSIALACPGTTLFRNNTGVAWQGEREWNADGSLTLRNPRKIDVGLCVGGSDLVGYSTVVITPEMVGKSIAVFTAVETKTEAGMKRKSKTREKQENFIRVVNGAGGKAGFASTPEQGIDIVNRPIQ